MLTLHEAACLVRQRHHRGEDIGVMKEAVETKLPGAPARWKHGSLANGSHAARQHLGVDEAGVAAGDVPAPTIGCASLHSAVGEVRVVAELLPRPRPAAPPGGA